jgi:hypothetical protein
MDSTTQIGFGRRSRDRPFTLYSLSNEVGHGHGDLRQEKHGSPDICDTATSQHTVHTEKAGTLKLHTAYHLPQEVLLIVIK